MVSGSPRPLVGYLEKEFPADGRWKLVPVVDGDNDGSWAANDAVVVVLIQPRHLIAAEILPSPPSPANR
jgi:hypothetical protein